MNWNTARPTQKEYAKALKAAGLPVDPSEWTTAELVEKVGQVLNKAHADKLTKPIKMTHTTKVTEMKSTEKGALDGFKVECTCGFTATNISKMNAQMDAHNHVEYMEKKEKNSNRK